MSRSAQHGDKVSVNYTGRSDDGDVFESSIGISPLEFVIGSGEVVKGFEDAVVGMVLGEKKTVTVEPEQGFGMYDKGLVFEITNDRLPDGVSLEVGMDFDMMDEEDNIMPAVVIEILENSVKIDANAPLAGKTVIYDIELLEILSRENASG